jgi:beta-glucosidase
MVTFHHFTSPRWVAAAGGWADAGTPEHFGRFVERAASHLRDSMVSACTINEPNWVATNGYILSMWPPGASDIEKGKRASENFVVAHRRAVEAIRAAAPGVPVGLTLSMTDFQAVDGGEQRLEEIRHAMEDVYLAGTEGDDYIGVQTYTRILVNDKGLAPFPDGARLTLMGYEFYPEALEACIRRAVEVTGLPVIVTENGIGTDNDTERIEYVERALNGVLRAIADGLDVRGYIYWSLLDNFEWAFGYKPTFGLVAVDRATQVRTEKPSARWLGGVARANALPA